MRLAIALLLASSFVTAHAMQQSPPASAIETNKPIPDIPTLMHQVEEHQRAAEEIRRHYLYHAVSTEEELDNKGAVKKTTIEERDIFFIEGVPVDKLVKRNGKDLTPDEQKKEDQRIDKQVREGKEKRAKREAKGEPTNARGDEVVTLSRILELGAFSNPRRTRINGRSTILIDYSGDPKAKGRSAFENIFKNITGTLSIDEETQALTAAEGHFVDNFHIGAGLIANVQKGLHFRLQQVRINDEVWLPSEIDGEGSARILLFVHLNGRIRVRIAGYRKFRATGTILPSVPGTIEPAPSDSQAPRPQ